jgi:hypothetical protein
MEIERQANAGLWHAHLDFGHTLVRRNKMKTIGEYGNLEALRVSFAAIWAAQSSAHLAKKRVRGG